MLDPCRPESLITKFNFNINPHMWDDHTGWSQLSPNIFVESNALPGFQEQVNQIINAINCGINKIECECLKKKVSISTFMITTSSLEVQCEDAFACTTNNRINIILENIFRPGMDNPIDLCLLIYHELMHTIDDCEACYDNKLSDEIDRITFNVYKKFKNQIPAIEKEIIDSVFENEQIKELLNTLLESHNTQKIAKYIKNNILYLNSRFFDDPKEFRAYANQFCVKGIRALISEFLYFEFTNAMPELADFERSINTIVIDITTDIYKKYFQDSFNQYCRMINELRTAGCNTNGLNMEFELELKPTGQTVLMGESLITSKYNILMYARAEKNSCCRKTEGSKGLAGYATVTLCPQCPKKCIFYYESIAHNDKKLLVCAFEQLFMGCGSCSTSDRTEGEGMLSIHKFKESIIKDFDDAVFDSIAQALPGLVRGREGCPC